VRRIDAKLSTQFGDFVRVGRRLRMPYPMMQVGETGGSSWVLPARCRQDP
jgi:hypothetical protein